MYLIFDVAGAGKVKSWKAPMTDTFNWPRLMHISWIVLGEDLKPIKDYNCHIKPVDFTVNEETAERHNVDPVKMAESGDELDDVLKHFKESLSECKYIFAHNLKFNESILAAEFLRKKEKNPLQYANTYCLMHESTFFCKLKGKGGGYKWPSLQELHCSLFNQRYSPPNNARADVIAASRAFIGLMRKGQLEDIFDLE